MMTTPPTTEAIPFPKTRDRDARAWLEAYGIVPKVPTIRSSDADASAEAPFTYYLERILGICDPIDSSQATRVGTWAHACLEHIGDTGPETDAAMSLLLRERQAELGKWLGARGLKPEAIMERQAEEAEEMVTARTYFEAACEIKIPNTYLSNGFTAWLQSPGFVRLAAEKRLVWTTTRNGEVLRNVIQPDILLYSKPTNAIWAFDLKSTAWPPASRLSCCPFEFQALHNIAGLMANRRWLIEHFNLPHDASVGGIYHLAFQKPTIKFGPHDRDYTTTTRTITRGPRKGQMEVEKSYIGDPKRSNFRKRCLDWMRGEGDYLDKADQRASSPIVNASSTSMDAFREMEDEYQKRHDALCDLATREPNPENFPRTSKGILSPYGALETHAPFYSLPIHDWPDYIEQRGLVLKRRDDDLDAHASIGLH